MEYDQKQFIADFSQRTDSNLKIIEILSKLSSDDLKQILEIVKGKIKDADPELIATISNSYEVTQLINSLFGLLIIPFERYRNEKIKGVYENQLRNKNGYQEIVNIIAKAYDTNRLCWAYSKQSRCIVSQFIRHLRNSLAHSGRDRLFFCCEERLVDNKWIKKIKSVVLYDTDGEQEFIINLDIDDIKELKNNLIKMFAEVEKEENAEKKAEEYDKSVKKLLKKCKKESNDAEISRMLENYINRSNNKSK